MRHLLVWPALAWLVALAPPSLAARDSEALALAKKLNAAFVEVAETVSPSVVIIRVAHRPGRAGFNLELSDENSPFWEMLPKQFRDYLKQQRDKQRPNQAPPEPFRHPPVFDGEGSGVVLEEDGYILTNFHVIEGADQILVRFKDGTEVEAEVRGSDAQSDLAVLRVKTKDRKLKPCVMGDSSQVRVGEFAIAIGAPFELDYSVTIGHVSAKGRSHVLPDQAMDQDFIQTDAHINPGNSGGPLVNINGEVIGINTVIRGLHTGIGFAVPVNLAREVAARLISDGKYIRAWLGVGLVALREYAEYSELVRPDQKGVVVTELLPDGPAAKSDLRTGDIITAVDGRAVANPMELKAEVRGKKVGAPVNLSVVRLAGGQQKSLDLKVRPEAWPEQKTAAAKVRPPTAGTTSLFGLKVETLTREAAQRHKAGDVKGVLVTEVEKGSEADARGLRAGDVINFVNQQAVVSAKEFGDALKRADRKKGILLHFLRDGVSTLEVLKERAE